MSIRLGDILVKKGLIKQEDLDRAIREQVYSKKKLGEILVGMGVITEYKFLEALGEQQGIPLIDLKNIEIEDKVIKAMPPKFVGHYKVMPIKFVDNILTIAISNPFDMSPIDDLETQLGLRIEKVLALSTDIQDAIKKYYGVGADTIAKMITKKIQEGVALQKDENDVEDIEKMSEDASAIRLVNQILQQAIGDRATDIHIERSREELVLRYRVDGVLYDFDVSESIRDLYTAIISRIKIMAGLDIVERRLPQDGRARVKISNLEYELRVSVIPAMYGENIAIRILPASMVFDMVQLGMTQKELVILDKLISKHHGIIFVTGPTGSGKTTTLYTCLSRLNTRERKVVTIEDPIEYELKGIMQTQINPRIGLKFGVLLRSMLRHDPDIMMVGEVRDAETADITIQTSLTGHLVFSTLHTNDAASGVTRLMDIGVEPFLIASSVEAFIAQRLIRHVCNNCKEVYPLKDMSEEVRSFIENSNNVFRGKGCKACNFTGYSGRSGIYEFLVVTDEIKKLINQKASADIIKNKALEQGMKTLKQSGWEKVAAGLTTPEEIFRVVQ